MSFLARLGQTENDRSSYSIVYDGKILLHLHVQHYEFFADFLKIKNNAPYLVL